MLENQNYDKELNQLRQEIAHKQATVDDVFNNNVSLRLNCQRIDVYYMVDSNV